MQANGRTRLLGASTAGVLAVMVGVADALAASGLVAVISDGKREVVTVQPSPHLSLAADESLHPDVGAAFEVVWTGSLQITEGGRYRFHAGEARLSIGGRALDGAGQSEVKLEAGSYPLRIEYARKPGPARLQIAWQSDRFAVEPLPAAALSAGAIPAAAASSRRRDEGRRLAAELGCRGCHADKGPAPPIAPKLTGIGARANERWLYHWLADPRAFRAGAVMPAMLDEAERRDVAAYLAGLSRASAATQGAAGRPERGEALYRAIGCTACHGGGLTLAGLGSKTNASSLAAYLRDPLAVDPSGRMPGMALDEGEAGDLAAFLVVSRTPAFERQLPAGVAADAGRGRALVQERGCLGCHGLVDPTPLQSRLVAPSFHRLRPKAGCLAPTPPPKAPRFRLDDEQRRALEAYVVAPDVARAPRTELDLTVSRLRCRQCHELGGPAAVKFEDVPPALSDTGSKLRTSWIDQVLSHKRRVRPWMTLRMPHYGQQNVGGLAPLFAVVAGAERGDGPALPVPDQTAIREGVRALGRGEEGLACITCHDFGPVPSQAGIRAPDMLSMVQRIRGDWFRRWMLAPARIQPGTQMPTFFAEVAPDVSERRINHLWAAISLGEGLPRPEGLVDDQQRITLAVGARPIVFRTFLSHASTMSIAVGFPGGRAFAFDADRCRPQIAWVGEFLDVTPVWVGRGGDAAKPLGRTVPLDPPSGGLRVGDPTRRPAVRFRGYTVDRTAPTFSYEVDGSLVKERIAPASDGKGWVRAITVGPGSGDLFFVTDDSPSPQYRSSAGTWADGRLRVERAPRGATKLEITITPQETR